MRTKQIETFQYITNQWSSLSLEEQTEIVCSAGCKWVQLRLKDFDENIWKEIALKIKEICKKYDATFIINDNVKIAKEIDADGVHLGQNDMLPQTAREILGKDAIIGGTANQFEQVQNLHDQKVDYIGLGPFRFTSTKKNLSPILGINGYKSIIQSCINHNINTPFIGIGGITNDDIPEILENGIYGIAASSIISNSNSPKQEINNILNTIKLYTNASIKNSR